MDNIIEECQKRSQRRYDDQKEIEKELSECKGIRLHYIFTLSLSKYPFLDLESIDGWYKYILFNTKMFDTSFKCNVSEYFVDVEKLNTEQFLLDGIIPRYELNKYRCSFENVDFDVCTDGKVFEVILNPQNKELKLDLSKRDFYELSEFFKRWCGELLVKSLDLTKYMDKHVYGNSIYESILDLKFHSFAVYTYPYDAETKVIQKFIERRFPYFKKKITDNLLVTYGANIPDKTGYYPPFQEYSVHIMGHVPGNHSYETKKTVEMLYRHMNYWSMIKVIDSFMGTISFFQDFEVYSLSITVKKSDFFKRLLFGKEEEHTQLKTLRDIKKISYEFLQLATGYNHRGLEEDASETYVMRNVAGEYFSLFRETSTPLITKFSASGFEESPMLQINKILDNADQTKLDDLTNDYDEIIDDLNKRMNEVVEKTRDLETKYYQDYQIKHIEKTQELTILSIISGIILFIISKIPFGTINLTDIIIFYSLHILFIILFLENIILTMLKLIHILIF